MSIWDAPKKVKKDNQIEETSASTQFKATEDKRTSAKPSETSAQTSASNKNAGTDTKQTSERKSGESAKLLKQLQSQLTLFNERLIALEQRHAQTAPTLEITEDLILKYSRWVLVQDPELVPKTVKNAIVKNYRRPAEDYVRLFQAFLKTLKPEA